MSRQRNKAIYGNSLNGRIKGATRRADIFVFRLEKETSVDDVKEYVTGKGVTVHEKECLSHEESMFRLSVCYSKLENVLTEESWSDGIGCRRFWRKRIEANNKVSLKSLKNP